MALAGLPASRLLLALRQVRGKVGVRYPGQQPSMKATAYEATFQPGLREYYADGRDHVVCSSITSQG